ncbi:MAG: Cna B-type domain-containing protein [Clostridia bacterium]
MEVTVTNTYGKDRVEAEIEGEKTWELGGYDKSVLPEAITVRLLCHGLLVEEELVTPDDNGEWHYHFTVPKYEADGEEIAYTVEEAPLDTFIPAYEGITSKIPISRQYG